MQGSGKKEEVHYRARTFVIGPGHVYVLPFDYITFLQQLWVKSRSLFLRVNAQNHYEDNQFLISIELK